MTSLWLFAILIQISASENCWFPYRHSESDLYQILKNKSCSLEIYIGTIETNESLLGLCDNGINYYTNCSVIDKNEFLSYSCYGNWLQELRNNPESSREKMGLCSGSCKTFKYIYIDICDYGDNKIYINKQKTFYSIIVISLTILFGFAFLFIFYNACCSILDRKLNRVLPDPN